MAELSRRQGKFLNRAGRLALAAAALAAPLCLGGVPPWAAWVCAPLVMLALWASAIGRDRLKLPLFAFVPLFVAAFCALQLVPLPPALLAFVSPPAEELRDFALAPLDLTAWRPISVETDATWRELAKYVLYAAAFLAAVHLSSAARGARRFLIGAVAVAGAAVVLLAPLHLALGLDALYGLYSFSAAPRLLTSFGNSNHLAGFLVVSGTLALALAIEAPGRRERVSWLVVFGTCAVGALLSLSRAGIGAFCFAQLSLLLALALTRRTQPTDVGARAVKWGAGALALLTAAVVVLFDRLAARFADTQTYALKLEVWPQAARAAREFWRTGMGRGAFEVGFTRFSTEHLGKTFTHPENFVLQLASEMGALAMLAVVALSAVALVKQLKAGQRSPLELAVAIAAVAVVLQNLFDFNLEFVGVALPLAIAFGVASGDAEGLWALRVRPRPLIAGFGLLMVAGFFFGRANLREHESDFLTQIKAVTSGEDAHQAALPFIAEHPADYLWYSAVAAQYVEKRPLEPLKAIAFANRALFLYPRDFRSHHIAARALRALGHRTQALLEYRLAYQSAWSDGSALGECVRFAKEPAELRACVPEDSSGLQQLFNVARGPIASNACVAVVGDAELGPGLGPLAVTCSKMLISENRLDEAIAVLDVAERRAGTSPDLAIGRAAVLRAQGRPDDAVSALEAALKQVPAHFALTLALADSYIAAKRYEAARAVVVHTTAVTTDSPSRATLKTLEGQIDQALGQLDRAVSEYRAAAQLAPTASRHYAVADLLMRQHAYEDAWAEIRAGERLDNPTSASATEDLYRTVEKSLRELEEQQRRHRTDP